MWSDFGLSMRRPEFIAKQGGRPSGWLGRIIAFIMEVETAAINQKAIALLDPGPGERVLDIGTGNGASLPRIAALTGNERVVGVDHSPVMCSRAARNNGALVEEGRVRVLCVGSDDLPFEADEFDAAISVHTLYFWNPAEPHLQEIARVLRPGGRLVLAFRPDSDPATSKFPDSVYTFRSLEEVEGLLSDCGFEEVQTENRVDGVLMFSAVSK